MSRINKKNTEDILALTPLQEGMLFHYLKAPKSPLYFEQLRIHLSGPLKVERFKGAWDQVTRTNRALRTVFRWEKLKAPAQIILKEHSPSISFVDGPDDRQNSAPRQGKENGDWAATVAAADRDAGFDLRNVPFRVTLCKVDTERFVMLVCHHHILYDGWSTGILLKEFFEAYASLSGVREPTPPVKPAFKEYLRYLEDRDRVREAAFWSRYLDGVDGRVSLAVKQGDDAGQEVSREMGKIPAVPVPGFAHRLEDFTREHKLTPAHLFYGAWGLLLAKYNYTRDLLFGTTVSGRPANIRGIEEMVGLFINTLPLRLRFHGGEPVTAFLSRLASELRERESYEAAAPAEILQYANVPGNRELFDTIMVIENYPLDQRLKDPGGNLSVEGYSMVEQAHYDLSVGVTVTETAALVDFQFRPPVLPRDTVERLASHYMTLLENIAANPGMEITALEMLGDAEKELVLEQFNRTAVDFPSGQTIHGLFGAQVEKTPDAHCLIDAGGPPAQPERLTYGQVHRRAEHLAGVMREKGILPGGIVAIKTPPCGEMVIGILAILKTGNAYLPIAPDYPEERIRFILADSNASLMLTYTAAGEAPDQKNRLELTPVGGPGGARHGRDLLTPWRSPRRGPRRAAGGNHDAAYVIYTSGTTGRPKGVVVPHAAFTNRLYHLREAYALGPGDVQLRKTVFTFDVSVCELFRCIVWGGAVLIADAQLEKDMPRLTRAVKEHGVTIMDSVPSPLALFLEEVASEGVELPRLRLVFTGVEAVDIAVVKRFREVLNRPFGTRLINAYGPTEATVDVTSFDCTAGEYPPVVPIGRPMSNTAVYILDPWGRPLPVGVPGQLCISGACLAYGYLNRPQLTAERFSCISSLSPLPSRFYLSGDFARWMPDGNILFLGRIDSQVKVRGFRIEPGEIEQQILAHEPVREAVVVAREDHAGDHYLTAYIVPGAAGFESNRLKVFLEERLPHYMVPAYLVQLDHLPLKPNGKVDKDALPLPDPGDGETYVAPRDQLELRLVEIWGAVLGVEPGKISIDADFFRLGGHSLKLARLASRVQKELETEVSPSRFFQLTTPRAQAQFIRELDKSRYLPITPAPEAENYPLSHAQRRLWVICRLDDDNTAYNQVAALTIRGTFRPGALESSVQALTRRHESLRTVFITIDGQPGQKILPSLSFNLPLIDLRRLEGEAKQAEVAGVLKETANRPFDLEKGPLFAFKLLRLEEETFFLVINIHHIINDGWSIEILKNELYTLYNYYLEKDTPGIPADKRDEAPLPAVSIQYKDYALWHNRLLGEGYLDRCGSYWMEKFKDKPTGIELPLDFPRKPVQTFNGGRVIFRVDVDRVRRLEQLGAGAGITLFMRLLTLMEMFLFRYTGQEDIILGSPAAGRRRPELHGMIGFLVNTLVYRNIVVPAFGFSRLLDSTREEILGCYENQDYPFDVLVERLGLERDLSRSPLFNVMMAYNNFVHRFDGPGMSGVQVTAHMQLEDINPSAFDLEFFWDVTAAGGLDGEIRYNCDLFRRGTVERMAQNLLTLLDAVLENPGTPVAELNFLSPEQLKQVLYTFNRAAGDVEQPEGRRSMGRPPGEPGTMSAVEKQQVLLGLHDTRTGGVPDTTLHRLFLDRAACTPDAVALVGETIGGTSYPGVGEYRLTYRKLERSARRLARKLQKLGVGPDSIVAVLVERSVEMAAVLLGVMMSGGAYLPIGAAYPEERVTYLLEDSGARWLAVSPERAGIRIPGGCIEVDFTGIFEETGTGGKPGDAESETGLDFSRAGGSNLAYVIYTSGTTGRPNGVLVEHRGSVNNVAGYSRVFGIGGDTHLLLMPEYTFDPSVPQLFGSLLFGAALHIPAREKLLDVNRIRRYILARDIHILNFVPAVLHALLGRGERLTCVRQVVSGGERLDDAVKESIVEKGYNLYNLYGPTETTVDAVGGPCRPGEPVVLGKPVPNACCYIFDHRGHPVPIGVKGELYIGGAGVARGYLNRPGLTGEKFIPYPQAWAESSARGDCRNGPGKRLYKTGDLACWLPDGGIRFLGRADQQLKIRGFRVEPGEIETCLLKQPGVNQAVVTGIEEETSTYSLCAYIVLAGKTPAGSGREEPGRPVQLKKALAKELPGYMVPSYFVFLDRLPLTPHGKVDLKSLPRPEPDRDRIYTAPSGDVEIRLAALWAEALQIDDPETAGVEDNFFETGGHSLRGMTLTQLIHKEFHVDIPLAALFENPTIRALAPLVTRGMSASYDTVEPVELREYYPASPSQKRLFTLQQMNPGGIHYNMPIFLSLTGTLDRGRLREIFSLLVARHESLRTSFHLVDGEPVQRVHETAEIFVPFFDMPAGTSAADVNARVKSFSRPFELSRAPLMRAEVLLAGPEQAVLMVDLHHIITDGVSQNIMTGEFMKLYDGRRLPPLRVQYKDYTMWYLRVKRGAAYLGQQEYWRRLFDGRLPLLNLPTDYPRPLVRRFQGNAYQFRFEGALTVQLKQLAAQQGVTMHILLQAVFILLMAKLSGQEDIVVGMAGGGRLRTELGNIIGFFLDMQAIRSRPRGNISFTAFLREVRGRNLGAHANRDFSFQQLVEMVKGHREPNRHPLFDVAFGFEAMDNPRFRLRGLTVEPYPYENITSKLDLTMLVFEGGTELPVIIEYDTQLFRAETIRRFGDYYRRICEAVAGDAHTQLKEIAIASPEEAGRLREEKKQVRESLDIDFDL